MAVGRLGVAAPRPDVNVAAAADSELRMDENAARPRSVN